MAIAFSQVATANSNNGSNTTHSFTGNGLASVSAVTDGIAFVCFDSTGLTTDPTSVTWGGVSMTKIATRNQTNRGNTESVWYVLNPASGAVTVVDNYSSANAPNMIWAIYSGVKQSAPEASNTGYSASSSLGVSVTTLTANAWVVGYFTNNFGTGVVGANTTARATNVLCIGDTNAPVVTPASTAQNWSGGTEWTGIVVSIAPATSLLSNIISYWKLDEPSGNAIDSVGTATLTNNGTTTFTSALINNGADYGTANTTKYFRSGTNNLGIDGGAITISTWVKMRTEIGSAKQVIALQGSVTSQVNYIIYYDYNAGTRRLTFNRQKQAVTNNETSGNATLGTTQWHHVVLTYDGTNLAGFGSSCFSVYVRF
jgi:hypothetical protein